MNSPDLLWTDIHMGCFLIKNGRFSGKKEGGVWAGDWGCLSVNKVRPGPPLCWVLHFRAPHSVSPALSAYIRWLLTGRGWWAGGCTLEIAGQVEYGGRPAARYLIKTTHRGLINFADAKHLSIFLGFRLRLRLGGSAVRHHPGFVVIKIYAISSTRFALLDTPDPARKPRGLVYQHVQVQQLTTSPTIRVTQLYLNPPHPAITFSATDFILPH